MTQTASQNRCLTTDGRRKDSPPEKMPVVADPLSRYLRTTGSHHEVALRSAGNKPERYIRYRRPVYPSALYLDGLLPYFVFGFDDVDDVELCEL